MTCSDDACHKIWRIGVEDLAEDYRESIIRGRAEVVDKLEKMKIQETTPSTRNSNGYQDITPSSDEHKESVLSSGKNKTLLL